MRISRVALKLSVHLQMVASITDDILSKINKTSHFYFYIMGFWGFGVLGF